MHRLTIIVWIAAGVALAGCAQVEGDADRVVIRHLAYQPLLADTEAEGHCERFGKKAVRVRTGPIESGPLAVQVRTSAYECVPPG